MAKSREKDMLKHSSKFLIIATSILLYNRAAGQISDSIKETKLPSIMIKAFEQNRKLQDIPAAISYIGKGTLTEYSPTSIVSAMNTVPGVRMEERSPGSYRLNIRGSSLRSPFGVRNVKIYYNDIPYTDPGGNSYLNELGYYNFNSIEIIKGANNSVYGAGTGGAMLVESLNPKEKKNVFAEYTTGSYRLQSIYGSFTTTTENSINKIGVQHQENNGYRNHSALNRNIYSWNGAFKVGERNGLKTTFLYGDLFYQTPGALTKAEYESAPTSSRPPTGPIPGAIQANTSIHQKLFVAGITYTQDILPALTNKTTVYGYFAELRNPSIASYGKSSEPNFGGRTVFNYSHPVKNGAFHGDFGFEYQKGFTSVTTSKNVNGNADSLRQYDEINLMQNFVFAQGTLDIGSITIIGGASLNTSNIHFERFQPGSLGKLSRSFSNQIAPRLAIMKKMGSVHLYTSVSKGFSPPTTAELVPTGGAINIGLSPEKALNFELGIKTTILQYLYIDFNTFLLSLENTIVQRHNANAGDYYDNAGGTRQHGFEGYMSYSLFNNNKKINKSVLTFSYTLYDFNYRNFKQQNTDFSGNSLPSVARNTINAGMDIVFRNGFFGTINYYYNDKIPLNDANSAYASSYNLLGAKVGIEKVIKRLKTRISLGGDNLFDQQYSLGNDINGFGGRYYNAAARRNYFVSFSIQLPGKKSI